MRTSLFTSLLVATSAADAHPIEIDGLFEDWENVPVLATDPPGDATGAFDITTVRARSQGTVLYIDFDITAERNLADGLGADGTLDLVIDMPSVQQRLVVDFRENIALANFQPVSWNQLAFATLPTYASTRFEARVDLSHFGVAVGDTVTIDLAQSDALPSPAPFTLADPPAPTPTPDVSRDACTAFRVASLSTLDTGLFHPTRAEPLARLIDGVDADIYCFQQEYLSDATAIADLLQAIDPLEDGAAWNVEKRGDNVIATSRPLIPVLAYSSSYAAAVVDLGGGEGVLVLTIHPKCCGYVGSGEDTIRIQQTQDMLQTITDVRTALPGDPVHPYRKAPVVLVGDWNLVGSRIPLDIIEHPGGAGLTHATVPVLASDYATSWRDIDGYGFPPGMLDLLTFSADKLSLRKRFTIDSSRLDSSTLSTLGILADDSYASEHLMLIADFGAPSLADLATTGASKDDPLYGMPDGMVDLTDLLYFVTLWTIDLGAPSPNPISVSDVTTTATTPGDPDYGSPDGVVNLADLLFFINVWEAARSGC